MQEKMTARKRMLTVLERGTPDMVPWSFYPVLIPRGEVERIARNAGCGLYLHNPAWHTEIHNVEICVREEWKDKKTKVITRTLHTPVGSVSEKVTEDPGYHSPWWIEYRIKNISDYRVVKFMVENTHYYEDFDYFITAEEDLGEDGIVGASVGYSPVWLLMYVYMGIEQFSLDLYDHPKQLAELIYLIGEKQSEAFRIAARSPARVVHSDDSLTGNFISPRMYKKYCQPFYNKQGQLLHEHNKIYAVHMDGKLKCLRNLIKDTEVDVIESFTLLEQGGDLPIEEARSIWEDKIIIINFPASLILGGRDKAKSFMLNLFKKIDPANNFIVEISEDLPHMLWKDVMLLLSDIIPKFKLK